jgi:hypothetical protein
MKLKFWKRSSKSKTAKAKKGKRQQKPEDCTECESLRTIVDGEFVVKKSKLFIKTTLMCSFFLYPGTELQSYRDKVVQQQQELDTLHDLLKT